MFSIIKELIKLIKELSIPFILISGRVSLCITTLLALITQFSGLKNTLPPVSYVNFIDIWMITCMMFVFTAMVEFSVVNVLDKKTKKLVTQNGNMKSLVRNTGSGYTEKILGNKLQVEPVKSVGI